MVTEGRMAVMVHALEELEPKLQDALCRDPAVDTEAPAQTVPQAIPSADVNLNAVLCTAAGAGPHPTVLLLHGLPGNEQNIDLAQAMRRAGWKVLTIHYRGSWGGPNTFSFVHCLEDADAALEWIKSATRDADLRLDADRIVVIGHSMGGFVVAHVAARHPAVRGVAMISGVDLGRSFGSQYWHRAVARVDDNVGIGAGLHILAGTSPGALAEEARSNVDRWCLTNYAVHLADRPFVVDHSNDSFAYGSNALAEAVQATNGAQLLLAHFETIIATRIVASHFRLPFSAGWLDERSSTPAMNPGAFTLRPRA